MRQMTLQVLCCSFLDLQCHLVLRFVVKRTTLRFAGSNPIAAAVTCCLVPASNAPGSNYYPTAYGLPTFVPRIGQNSSFRWRSQNYIKSVKIESQGTFWGLIGALLGSLLAQRAKSIQNVSSLAALRGPSETPNLMKLGRHRPNASPNYAQNLISESCFKTPLKQVEKWTLYWTLDVLKT